MFLGSLLSSHAVYFQVLSFCFLSPDELRHLVRRSIAACAYVCMAIAVQF